MSASAIYEGTIRHRRFEPVGHEFSYPFFMVYLDLAELPTVLDRFPLWSARRRALGRFRRSDYLGEEGRPLDACVRDLVEAETGARPRGRIRLLTHLRYLGHSFNPISLYYCFEPGGRLQAVVADVANIPWGESHPYVLARGAQTGTTLRSDIPKELHVSPLMTMDHTYDFRATEPGEQLLVHIDSNANDGGKAFDATLSLRRREMTQGLMAGLPVRYPAATLTMVARIYWQALRLKLRGAKIAPHPTDARPAARSYLAPPTGGDRAPAVVAPSAGPFHGRRPPRARGEHPSHTGMSR